MRSPLLPPLSAAGMRRWIDAARRLAAALALAGAVALPACAAGTTADVATRALLDQLEERKMPDVALWVLDRVQADPSAAADLKAEEPFRRALALVGLSRTEADGKKRAGYVDQAKEQIDKYLATAEGGRRLIDAYTQKGNLLVEQGKTRLEQAKRPGADGAALRKEAVGFFTEALKALEGKVKPGEEITKVDNAEDAVVSELRAVTRRLNELKPKDAGSGADKDKKPVRRPVRRDAAGAKEVERLEADQSALQAQLVQTRLMIANVYFERAKAYDANSKEWKATLEESTKQFKEIADKYPTLGGGLLARYYQGRNLAVQGEREKAVAALGGLVALEDKVPLAILLRTKALGTTLECWLADKKLEFFDAKLRAFALSNVPAGRLDADWLAVKYRAAAMLKEQAAATQEAAKGKPLLADAVRLAKEVVAANRDFADEARELLKALGKEGNAPVAEKTFAGEFEDARLSLEEMKRKQAEAKQAADPARQAELLAAAAAERAKTIAGIGRALKLAGDDDLAAVNQARYLLTFLFYEGQRLHDAAALGTFLAERYPNAKGSRQAAKIAMASWQQLERQPEAAWRKDAGVQCAAVAELIMRTWPAEVESADAAIIAIGAATAGRDPARILAVAAAVPAESPRRPEVLARAGTALWREVMEQGRLEEGARAPAETVAAWKKAAREFLDAGLAAPAGTGVAFRSTVAAALARCQIALDEGDAKAAVAILEDPKYGPWKVVNDPQADAALREGSFAEAVLTVALRSFIQAEQIDKAQQAMDRLEKLAGGGDSEEKSARLTAMYLSMARELQGQLERLGAAGASDAAARQQATSILGGFETFLDGLAKRDPKVSSQIWVATTFLTLGSGRGTGSVVPKAKAEQYLDRAAEVYKSLLDKKGDADVARFEPSIRLKMAAIYREREKWDDAMTQIDWILADAKRQNSLESQVQAAEILQAAGQALAATDAAAAEQKFREATTGRTAGPASPAAIWGWHGISGKVGRQAFAGSDEKALKARDVFFNALFNKAACLFARSQLSGKSPDQAKELRTKAEQAIAMPRKLYPELGGPAMQVRFEKLLKEIQKLDGAANPRGFVELDERAAAAAATPPATN